VKYRKEQLLNDLILKNNFLLRLWQRLRQQTTFPGSPRRTRKCWKRNFSESFYHYVYDWKIILSCRASGRNGLMMGHVKCCPLVLLKSQIGFVRQ